MVKAHLRKTSVALDEAVAVYDKAIRDAQYNRDRALETARGICDRQLFLPIRMTYHEALTDAAKAADKVRKDLRQ